MTGILPIAKYSSGSELNMFAEFTMTTEQRFSEYFGFTDEEVDGLQLRYIENCASTKMVTRDDLREWYDGYHTRKGERLYNPRSIVLSLSNNNVLKNEYIANPNIPPTKLYIISSTKHIQKIKSS